MYLFLKRGNDRTVPVLSTRRAVIEMNLEGQREGWGGEWEDKLQEKWTSF